MELISLYMKKITEDHIAKVESYIHYNIKSSFIFALRSFITLITIC